MADLLTPAAVLRTFFRLLNITEDDDALTENGEATNEVAFQYLTRGVRDAQRYLLSVGYDGWRRLSDALVWTKNPVRSNLAAPAPDDFLRAWGNLRRSALITSNGTPWGREIESRDGDRYGNFYYFRRGSLSHGDMVWLTRGACPPRCLFLDYHYRHPEWSDSVEIDFPLEVRGLIPATAASLAMEEAWLPGDRELELKISRALSKAQAEARDVGRPSKQARRLRAPVRFANRW